MDTNSIDEAGKLLWQRWQERARIDALPNACRPRTRAEGYAIQAALARATGDEICGWKIAATSVAGQRHIGVDGPLAGCLFASRVVGNGSSVSLQGNAMRVAEAELVFELGASLPPRKEPYTMTEVREAVAALRVGIEIPDSRFVDFAMAGAPQLIAECACADWYVLGEHAPDDWRNVDLRAHRAFVHRNGALVAEGVGANVLGDPWLAMLWIANELREFGPGLRAGAFVTTGACVVPQPVLPGDRVTGDFGLLGRVTVDLT